MMMFDYDNYYAIFMHLNILIEIRHVETTELGICIPISTHRLHSNCFLMIFIEPTHIIYEEA